MASLLHIAVGMAAGRYLTRRRDPVAMVAMAGLSMLPDADVLAFPLGIPYEAPLGHRGAAHSLVFALGTGSLCGLVARLRRKPWLSLAIVSVCVVASHPLLDAMTTGG